MTGSEKLRNWPAGVRMTELALIYQHSAALRAVAVLGIADHLADEPLGLEDLARRAGVSPPHLLRVLRLLVIQDVFTEVDGLFGLTEQGELLRSDVPGSMRAGLIMVTDDAFWLPAARLADVVRRGETVFPEIFDGHFFEYLERTGGASEFHHGMAELSSGEDDPVAAALPLESGVVVDVGGGRGGLLAAILRHHPETTGVLFERTEALAAHVLDRPELAGRWRTETGDFFDRVPSGANAYVLKRILHDWTDDDCVRMLTVIRAAVPAEGRVYVVDGVMPDDTSDHPLRVHDLLMMSALDGYERHEREFRALFARAGFELVRTIPTDWTMSVVEGRPASA